MNRKYLVLAALLTALAAVAGCIFSPGNSGDGGEPPVPMPFPDTPDKLMANFQTVYEKMDFAAFSKMLHPDYVTILKASTTAQYPDVGTTLDVAEELRIHERMFGGRPVTDPQGTLVPGISQIQFQALNQVGIWTMSPSDDQIPNAQNALYEVIFLFDRGGTYSTLRVEGEIKFYVTHRDSIINGVPKPYYRMRGQVDLTKDQ